MKRRRLELTSALAVEICGTSEGGLSAAIARERSRKEGSMIDLTNQVPVLGQQENPSRPMDLGAIEKRANVSWQHPITRVLDMDQARLDTLAVIDLARKVRAQLASFVKGLRVNIPDPIWEMEPSIWERLGERVSNEIVVTVEKRIREATGN
jgi:hypothetical protein